MPSKHQYKISSARGRRLAQRKWRRQAKERHENRRNKKFFGTTRTKGRRISKQDLQWFIDFKAKRCPYCRVQKDTITFREEPKIWRDHVWVHTACNSCGCYWTLDFKMDSYSGRTLFSLISGEK